MQWTRAFKEIYDEANKTADWRPIEVLNCQIGEIFHDGKVPQELLFWNLAERLERVTASYTGQEDKLVEHALAVWILSGTLAKGMNPDARGFWDKDLVKEFNRYYDDPRFNSKYLPHYKKTEERRRPKPFETIVETARRLRELMAIRVHLSRSGHTGAILGGSASYGRFYNVKGNIANKRTGKQSASDIDLLVIVRSWDDLSFLTELRDVEGISSPSVDELMKRVGVFHSLLKTLPIVHGHDFIPISFSHKVPLWSGMRDPLLPMSEEVLSPNYDLSLHVVNQSTFQAIIMDSLPIFGASHAGYYSNVIYDYRQDSSQKTHVQKSFDGRHEKQPMVEEQKVEGGVLTSRLAAFIERDRYFPGFHQNLILPKFDIRWEDNKYPLEFRLDAFKSKLIERLRSERLPHPGRDNVQYRIHRLSMSHTRSLDLAPHVSRKIDGG